MLNPSTKLSTFIKITVLSREVLNSPLEELLHDFCIYYQLVHTLIRIYIPNL